MERVVVVSRNPALAWGLAAPDRDLIEVRPHQLDTWLEGPASDNADAIVLDLTDSGRSREVLVALRSRAQLAPALLVAGDDTGWDEPEIRDLPAALVLPLPVTQASLQSALARLLAPGPAEPAAEAGTPAAVPDAPDAAPESSKRDEDPTRTDEVSVVVDAEPDPIPLPRTPRTAEVAQEALTTAARHTRTPPSPEAPQAMPARATRPVEDSTALVRSLTSRVGELFGVQETAAVVLADAVERVGGDAAALLLPDGERWRVAAGHGLKPLEHRFEPGPESWLIAEVARSSHGILIADTDIERRRLAGAPLGSRRHLVAAPIVLVEAVLIVARDTDPGFENTDVARLASMSDEAGVLLAAALDIRDLARRLLPLADLPD
jgi:hypothetical protein